MSDWPCAEVLDRQLGGGDRARPADVGVEARHVAQHADLDVDRSARCAGAAGQRDGERGQAHKTSSLHSSLLGCRWIGVSSDPEIVVQLVDVGVQFGVGEPVDDAAVLHHVVAVGDGRGEAEVLLDQQDGEALLPSACGWCVPICWMMTGASPSVGSSSSSSRAPVRRMRPIASICCSPPDSLVPWLSQPLLEVREQLEDRVERQPARLHHAAAAAGSPRRSRLAKMPRSSGQNAMPAPRDRVRRPGRSARGPRSAPSRRAGRRCP